MNSTLNCEEQLYFSCCTDIILMDGAGNHITTGWLTRLESISITNDTDIDLPTFQPVCQNPEGS